jgi:mono/diheme cytochrome c family protein
MRSRLAIVMLCCGLLGACIDEAEINDEEEENDEDVPECTAVQAPRVDTITSLPADKAAGAMVFSQTCAAATCHGGDGSEGPAPNLSDEIPEFDSEALLCLLLNGKGDMPSQASLSDQQLADVIAYVQATF